MTRTNIEIDDDLIARAMAKYGLATKRSAVEFALQRLVGPPLTGAALADFLLDIEGSGWDAPEDAFDDDLPEVG
jgi:Arc/MetJ family transcription regulator